MYQVGDWVLYEAGTWQHGHILAIGQVLAVYGTAHEIVDAAYAGKAKPHAWSQLFPESSITGKLEC